MDSANDSREMLSIMVGKTWYGGRKCIHSQETEDEQELAGAGL